MKTNMILTPCSDRLRAIVLGQAELMRTSETVGLSVGVQGVVKTAPIGASMHGTSLSAASTTTAYKATALLPISDVVVFDGFAGCRFWSPPV